MKLPSKESLLWIKTTGIFQGAHVKAGLHDFANKEMSSVDCTGFQCVSRTTSNFTLLKKITSVQL